MIGIGNLINGLYILFLLKIVPSSSDPLIVDKSKTLKRKISSFSDAHLCHLRLSHIGIDSINHLVKDSLPICEPFLQGKITKASFKKGQ